MDIKDWHAEIKGVLETGEPILFCPEDILHDLYKRIEDRDKEIERLKWEIALNEQDKERLQDV